MQVKGQHAAPFPSTVPSTPGMPLLHVGVGPAQDKRSRPSSLFKGAKPRPVGGNDVRHLTCE